MTDGSGNGGTDDTPPTENLAPQAEQLSPAGATAMVAATFRHKLPTFWSNMPEIWFIQVEQIFALNRISADDSKYRHVIAVLPQEALCNVVDLLKNPPMSGKYDSLKEALITRHSLSENKRLEELLSSSEIGDRSPSSFFRDMENKLGTSSFANRDLLKRLWLRKLPEPVKVAVTSSNMEEVSNLLTLADKVWEVTHTPSVFAVTSTPPHNSPSTIEVELLKAVQNLTLEVAALKSDEKRTYRGRGRDRSRSRSRSRGRDDYCWYHSNFGDRASRCIPPCQFVSDKKADPSKKND